MFFKIVWKTSLGSKRSSNCWFKRGVLIFFFYSIDKDIHILQDKYVGVGTSIVAPLHINTSWGRQRRHGPRKLRNPGTSFWKMHRCFFVHDWNSYSLCSSCAYNMSWQTSWVSQTFNNWLHYTHEHFQTYMTKNVVCFCVRRRPGHVVLSCRGLLWPSGESGEKSSQNLSRCKRLRLNLFEHVYDFRSDVHIFLVLGQILNVLA